MPTYKEKKVEQTAAASSSVMTFANALTAFRIVLIIPFLYLINQGRFAQALAVFFLASVTDFADGYVARKFGQQSPLGQALDPLADKLLTTTGFVIMAFPHSGFPSIPIWLAGAVVGRDLLILIGSLAVYLYTRSKDFKPTLLGKVNTFLELGLIVAFLTVHTFGILIFLLPLCYAIVLASVLLSGASYIVLGVKMMRDHRKAIRSQAPMAARKSD